MTTPSPVYAMVSMDIRRDLVEPLRHFRHLRLAHFYRRMPYGDLTDADMADAHLHRFGSPADLFRQLARLRPDIVQGVEPFAISQLPYQAAILAYALPRRVPLVCGVHISRPLPEKYGPVAAALLRLLAWPVVRYARLFLYLNDGGRRNLLWMGAAESRLVRHMFGTWGVDVAEFTPERDGREPEWMGRPTLLFVGRLHPEKGLFDVLHAFGSVRRAHPDAQLAFIGSGSQWAEAEAFVRAQGWQDDVRFLGTVKHRDLPPYFRAATLFVSPAVTTKKWEEYVGMTNIQAMASGVPVVSTRSGAIPEYVPDGVAGLLVPERDPQALAEAMLRLLADADLRRRLGEAGRLLAVAQYDAVKNVQRAEAIILARCGYGGDRRR